MKKIVLLAGLLILFNGCATTPSKCESMQGDSRVQCETQEKVDADRKNLDRKSYLFNSMGVGRIRM